MHTLFKSIGSKRPNQKGQCMLTIFYLGKKIPKTIFGIYTYYGLLQCNLPYSAILERKTCEAKYLTCKFFIL